MAKFKLVIPKVLPAYKTGDELKKDLVAMDFKVTIYPKIIDPNALMPPKPPFPEDTEEHRAAWAAWYIERNKIIAQYEASKIAFNLAKSTFVAYLAGIFKIAEYKIVGQNPNGTKKREFVVVDVPSYGFTYSTCASRLQTIPNPIDFICYSEFIL